MRCGYLDRVEGADFQTVWNRYRRKAGIKTKLLAWVIRLLPRIGALSDLAIKVPTPQTQDLYIKSVNHAIAVYAGFLQQVGQPLPNLDLDTGEMNRAGAYALTDKTYATLLHRIVKNAGPIAPDLKRDILHYYGDANAKTTTEIRRISDLLRD